MPPVEIAHHRAIDLRRHLAGGRVEGVDWLAGAGAARDRVILGLSQRLPGGFGVGADRFGAEGNARAVGEEGGRVSEGEARAVIDDQPPQRLAPAVVDVHHREGRQEGPGAATTNLI